MAKVTGADIFSVTQIFVNFDSAIKTNDALFNENNYSLVDSNSNIVVIKRVVEVDAESVSMIFLVVEKLTEGLEYIITVNSTDIVSTDGTPLSTTENFTKFIGRQTKTDTILKSRPQFYNISVGSTYYGITGAIGRQDDLIGGDRSDPNTLNDSPTTPIGPQPLPGGLADLVDPTKLVPAMGAQGVMGDPEWYWMGRDLVGAIDLIGSDNLSDVGPVTKNVIDPSFNENLTNFAFNSTASMDASITTVCDVTTESYSWVFIGRPNLSTFGRQWFGKRVDTISTGYEVFSENDGLRFSHYNTGGAAVSAVISIAHDDGNAHAVGGTVDYNTGFISLYSKLGFDSVALPAATNISSSMVFSLGSNRLLAENIDVALFAFWRGTDAEGMILEYITNLNTGLGI